MKRKGFTLIELMVVIAIIAVLAAIMAPQIFRQVAKGRVAAAEGFHNTVKIAATSYFSDLSVWPATCVGLTGAFTNCNTIAGVNGGFVTTAPANANWDGPYIDRWPGTNGNPWRGNYNWVNNAASNIFNPPGAVSGERYLYLFTQGGLNLTSADAQRIDRDIDRVVNGASGLVRRGPPVVNGAWPAAGTIVSVYILVSRDGPVN